MTEAINETFDVVCVGNYTKDTIVSPAGVTYVDGGAMNYAAHASARLGVSVAVITRLAEEDQRVIDNLNQAGVCGLVQYTPFSTCVKLEYPTTNPDLRNLYVTSTAGSITIDQVSSLRTRTAVIGTTLRGEVGLDVIHALHDRVEWLAADVQGFVRVFRGQSLVYEPWSEMRTVLSCVDILKSDAVEAEFLTGESDIHKAAEFYAGLGAREVVLTHKDGLLVYANGQFFEFGFYPVKMDGRSGRGDTCLGAYTSMRLSMTPEQAGMWAAALTSLKMEILGPFNRSRTEIEDLIRLKYRG